MRKKLSFLKHKISNYHIYISGKITGDDNYLEKFNDAENTIKKNYKIILGNIINPVWLIMINLNEEEKNPGYSVWTHVSRN